MTQTSMTPQAVEALFTDVHGHYHFARWGRPIAPIVFGVDDATLATVKGAFEAFAALTGQELAETDPELGSNCMVFFFRSWQELLSVRDLDLLLPDLPDLIEKLEKLGANQYRVFRFDDAGAIKSAFVFLQMNETLSAQPAEDLALSQVAQVMLIWGEGAFSGRSPLADVGGTVILRPDIADVIRAGYDPVMPACAEDPSHALRLHARIGAAA